MTILNPRQRVALAALEQSPQNAVSNGRTFNSIDDVIKARTPAALRAIDKGLESFNTNTDSAITVGSRQLRRYTGGESDAELNRLLGNYGNKAQAKAINGIPVSDYDQELYRRQQKTQQRQAFASGDVSGASMLQGQQLAGQQQFDKITSRVNQLMPLSDLRRAADSQISQMYETGYYDKAAQDLATGTQRANVRLGGVAPLIQQNLSNANISGLQGIGAANERGAVANSLAGLAGQLYQPGYQAPVNSTPVIGYNAGYSNPNYSPVTNYNTFSGTQANPNYSPVSQPF
tara:strand:+ start:2045 stop:2911 length:867 start_codon:yes stop_codon:yes gene_type:complete